MTTQPTQESAATPSVHTEGKWCADLHCSRCYGAATWQNSRIAALEAELAAQWDEVADFLRKIAHPPAQAGGEGALLDKFPNLSAIYQGTISGALREWPAIRNEMRRFVDSLAYPTERGAVALTIWKSPTEETVRWLKRVPIGTQLFARSTKRGAEQGAIEELELIADTADNLLAAATPPMSASIRVAGLMNGLCGISKQARAALAAKKGEKP